MKLMHVGIFDTNPELDEQSKRDWSQHGWRAAIFFDRSAGKILSFLQLFDRIARGPVTSSDTPLSGRLDVTLPACDHRYHSSQGLCGDSRSRE
jgi:hypothetical protein